LVPESLPAWGGVVMALAVCVVAALRVAGPTVVVSTPGLSIAFDKATAAPVSVKNAEGEELLEAGATQLGFYMQRPGNSTAVPFDTVTQRSSTELLFGMAATGEQIGWAFGGAKHYLTLECTMTKGFEPVSGDMDKKQGYGFPKYWGDSQSVTFELSTTTLRGIGLNYMVYDATAEGQGPPNGKVHIFYEAPWVPASGLNPPARFGVYEIVDAETEDETLIDFWVDEGLPHPRVAGAWDRARAKAWIQEWIASQSDISNFAMVPKNLSEWREFIPLAKKAGSQVLWFNFRAWDWTSIDNVNPHMFPNGTADFKSFSEDAAKQGLRLSTHRMSGGLDPRDPDYCAKPSPGLLTWGNMTLSAPAGASDATIKLTPAPGTQLPLSKGEFVSGTTTCNVGGEEYVTFKNITVLPSGWAMELKEGLAQNFSAGTLVRCFVRGNVYFIPDTMSPLYNEIAERYANFSNLIQFQDGSFDGAAWFAWYGRWGFYKFATLVYENLDHPTAVHTSGVLVSPGWPEYRFNAVRSAFGGPFTHAPAGAPLRLSRPGHPQPGLEEVSSNLMKGLAANSRDFSVGQDIDSTLESYAAVGNTAEILDLVREYKAGSLAMTQGQREAMKDAVYFTEPRRGRLGGHNTAKARWMVEGDVYRKWANAGTAVYDTLSFAASSYVPSRFYLRSGTKQALVLPPELASGFERAAVVGRLLPTFKASSPDNIDLLAKMGAPASISVSASNPASSESWDESRLSPYSVEPLDLTRHQGVGMYVDGDGSGGTLVVRVSTGSVARDYAVPLSFTGRQWVEIPAGEAGWSMRNWGPTGKGAIVWVEMDYAKIDEVAVGIGYLPPNTTAKASVSGLQALSQVETPLVDPRITVGGQTVAAKGRMGTYDQFTLDAEGTFTVYDSVWHFISNCSVGPFRPHNLTSFEMTAAAADPAVWLEIGVSAGTSTVPNPAKA